MVDNTGNHSEPSKVDNVTMGTSNYAERLQLAIQERQITVRDLSDALGLTTQAIYKVLRGQTKALQAGHHLKAAKYLQVDPAWLSDGAGSRHSRGPIALNNNPEYPAVNHVEIDVDQNSGYAIKQVDAPAMKPIVFRATWFESRGYKPGRLVAITVSGSSMEPTLYPDDVVILNLDANSPSDGSVFAIAVDGQLALRRVFKDGGTWWLHSDNTDARRFPRKLLADGQVIGQVVHRQSERL